METPNTSRAEIKPDEWRVGLDIYPDGTIRERDIGVYRHSLLFDTNELTMLWPSGGRAIQPLQPAELHGGHGIQASATNPFTSPGVGPVSP